MTEVSRHVEGTVVSLWRYPVKSMQGEELNASVVTSNGLLGDRAYALLDKSDGKVASAKNPRKWPLFAFRAAYVEPPQAGGQIPAVCTTFPDGGILTSLQADVDARLSTAIGREVNLVRSAPAKPILEEYWPDVEGLTLRETVTDEAMPAGLFFDCAVVHLLTTATVDRLRQLYPQGRFEVRRFRPNIVVQASAPEPAFVENAWVGRNILIGDQVRLSVQRPCGRCVMTTLPQADLPSDSGILRTAVKHNQGNIGVYASVLQGGTIRCGDTLRFQ